MECSICMDDIDFKKNCITTDCGHHFHASCLMTNVAHNGFGCPYCRSAMAEMPEDDDESEWSEISGEEEMFDDYALRGLRFFTSNLEGEEHDQEDILEEQEDMEDPNAEPEEQVIKPTPAFIAHKLAEQGVTMEYIVKSLLKDHDEYDAEEEECMRADDDIFGKLRIIISNYQPEVPVPQVATTVDVEEEPKVQVQNVTTRRIMMHV